MDCSYYEARQSVITPPADFASSDHSWQNDENPSVPSVFNLLVQNAVWTFFFLPAAILPTLQVASIFCLLMSLSLARGPWISTHVYSPNTVNGSSDALFTSSAHSLDAPKVEPINETSYEWWYFDAVSADQQSGVVLTFFVAPATGFPQSGAPDNAILSATIALSYPGQELVSFLSSVPATEATVVSVGNGASGSWEGSGINFVGTPDLENYIVNVDSPSIGVKGFMSLHSVGLGCIPEARKR